MKLAIGWFNKVVEGLLRSDDYRATKFLSDKEVIRATRRHRPDRRDSRIELVVTVGAPNYRERKFIKLCKRANESFPVKSLQFQPWPRKRGV